MATAFQVDAFQNNAFQIVPPTPQAVGDGAIAMVGVLGWTFLIAVGGAITIAGTLSRNIFLAVGVGAVSLAGSLGRKIFFSLGGAISITGVIARKIKLAIGSGAINIASILGTRWLLLGIPDWRKMRGKKLTTIDRTVKLEKNW